MKGKTIYGATTDEEWTLFFFSNGPT